MGYRIAVRMCKCLWMALFVAGICAGIPAWAQIDPVKRDLFQFGYNQPLEGKAPLSAYAFYYYNRPNFLDTNLTLRLAVAPVYLDSELGISHLLGPNTDFAVGLAGGGYADSYYEVNQGKYLSDQSFTGNGGTLSASIYHLFDPGARIPLSGVLRGDIHYVNYQRDGDTSSKFELPENQKTFDVKAGLRFGGKEPVLVPDVAMELSVWYQGQFRLEPGNYGYATNQYHTESASHLFWSRALLAYTLPESKHSFMVSVTGGTSIDPDRFSAYRLGGFLPLASEFPLSIPGYYFQELSASRFALFNGSYNFPLDKKKRWTLTAVASTAYLDYLHGLEQPGKWNTGVGGGLAYLSSSGAWQVMLDYGYGFDAVRTHGRGAQTIGLLLQFNLERTKGGYYNPGGDNLLLRGFDRFLHSFN